MSLFLPVVAAFNRAGISYVTVGGLAGVLHGHARVTTDIDMVIALDKENVLKAIGLLRDLGYVPRAPVSPEGLADPAIRGRWIAEKGMVVLSFFNSANPVISVDLFCDYPMDYTELRARSIEKPLGLEPVRVCAIGDLIALKRKAGRPIDLEDIRNLENLRGTS